MAERDFFREQIRTSVIIVIGFVILLYILLSQKMFFEAKVYGAMGIFTIFILFTFKWFWKHSAKKESLSEAYIGVNGKPITGILIGAGFAVGFLLLTQIKVFSSVAQLITPTIPLSSVGATAIVVCLLAPIWEEFAFTGSLSSLLNLYMPFPLVAIIKGLLFSAVHYYAYVIIAGTTLNYAIGAFIGAGIFGFLSAYIGKYYGIQASQVGHGIFNTYNFIMAFQLLSVVG